VASIQWDTERKYFCYFGERECFRVADVRSGDLGVHVNLRWRLSMAKLTTAKKNKEPKSEFGLPKQRKYPMPDASHARNAKARASQMEHRGKLSAADKKKIDTKADRILKKK
jgi:hypothetical protein